MKKLLSLFGSLGLIVTPTASFVTSCDSFEVPYFNTDKASDTQFSKAWNFTQLKEISLSSYLLSSSNVKDVIFPQIQNLLAGRFQNFDDVFSLLSGLNTTSDIYITSTANFNIKNPNDPTNLIYTSKTSSDLGDDDKTLDELNKYIAPIEGNEQKVYISLVNSKNEVVFSNLDIYLTQKPELSDFNNFITNSLSKSTNQVLKMCIPFNKYKSITYDSSKIEEIEEVKASIINDLVSYSYLAITNTNKVIEKVDIKKLFVFKYINANGIATHQLESLTSVLQSNLDSAITILMTNKFVITEPKQNQIINDNTNYIWNDVE